MIASQPGIPESNAVLAITIEAKTMMAPQERSMPAVRMIRVWPTASAPTTATCWVISERLLGVANLLFSIPKTMTLMTSTTAGLSQGYWCSVVWIRCAGVRRSRNSSAAS